MAKKPSEPQGVAEAEPVGVADAAAEPGAVVGDVVGEVPEIESRFRRKPAIDLSTLEEGQRAHVTAYCNAEAERLMVTSASVASQVCRDADKLRDALAFPIPEVAPVK